MNTPTHDWKDVNLRSIARSAGLLRTLKKATDRSAEAVKNLIPSRLQQVDDTTTEPVADLGEMHRFDEEWESRATLNNGETVYLRLLSPLDGELLEQGFQKLSEESRYQRFMTNLESLPERYVEHLVDVDNDDHLAVAALRRDEVGREVEGVGVARYFRDRNNPKRAEIAVTVIDDVHGTGLGTLLFGVCGAAAWERGIHTLHAEVLPENRSMQRLAERFGGFKGSSDSGLQTWEIEIKSNDADSRDPESGASRH
jgi:RimJ/RimL family protein N-acetyltransferase